MMMMMMSIDMRSVPDLKGSCFSYYSLYNKHY